MLEQKLVPDFFPLPVPTVLLHLYYKNNKLLLITMKSQIFITLHYHTITTPLLDQTPKLLIPTHNIASHYFTITSWSL